MLAVLRIRGSVTTSGEVEDTLKMLKLGHVNSCVVLPEMPSYQGMIEKCKDWVAYGKINHDVFLQMLKKRGRIAGDKKLDETVLKNLGFKSFEDLIKNVFDGKMKMTDIEGLNPTFRLSPPTKGYSSIRNSYPEGSLGNWGDKINELLAKMI
ncbi:MAG TPA: 50S ribosomal protein L30 [archaeon]|nr:50S ribosomal protein L30 [archaeon]